jgi:hypothetical protein
MRLEDWALRHVTRVQSEDLPRCKVCGASTSTFDVVDFSKTCNLTLYPTPLVGCPVYYFRCNHCGLIFTTFCDAFSTEDWQRHVYNSQYQTVDPDYASTRPRSNAAVLSSLLRWHKRSVVGLDFGGGSGLTAELLRRAGYSYDSFDPFGESRLSIELEGRYNFCSTFEVAEHSPNPREMVSTILSMLHAGKVAILIGTQVHEGIVSDNSRLSWWYIAPRNGHISIYSRRSLQILGEQFGLACHSFSRSFHLLTRGYNRMEAYALAPMLAGSKLERVIRRALRLS